ncbi:MAG: hypothetical protein K1X75_08495 [Leptospirales bacterium]|nr:hypothetical protein [Leptospirales bacterium]
MLRILALTWLCSAALFALIPRSIVESARIASIWRFHLDSGDASTPPRSLGSPPFNLVRYQEEEGFSLRGPGVVPQPLQRSDQATAPFLGRGFFLYSQIGRQIAFFSREGEELWRKPFFSYPVSDESGQCVLLLAGDGNVVEQIDASGNSIGHPLQANLIADYAFAARRPIAAVAFLNGRSIVVNQKAERLGDIQPDADEPMAFKSVALSSDGHLLALHARRDQEELLQVYRLAEGEAELLDEFSLPREYAHPISLAVWSGGVLAVAPDEAYYFPLQSGGQYSAPLGPLSPASGIYRPAYAEDSFAAYGAGTTLSVLSADGRNLAALELQNTEGHWRIVAALAPDTFAVQSAKTVEFFHFSSF